MTDGSRSQRDPMCDLYLKMLDEKEDEIRLLAGFVNLPELDAKFRAQYRHPYLKKIKRFIRYIWYESIGAMGSNYQHKSFYETERWYKNYMERRLENYEHTRVRLQEALSRVQAPGAYRTK